MMNYIIGVDFDNTIISYDDILHKVAVERSLISPSLLKSKKHIRDDIRRLPDGEIEWQKLQAVVYGPRIKEATLIDGVQAFINSCRRAGVKIYIISHKTEFANYDRMKINLRSAALQWMFKNRFFEKDGLGFSQEDVYFETTRLGKIKRVTELNCTHFIDDLEETFLERSFPGSVEKILFAPHDQTIQESRMKSFPSWLGIQRYLFNEH